MKKFLALIIVLLCSAQLAVAQANPTQCGTISSKRYTNSEWWAGLEYTNYIRPGTPGDCEAPAGKNCYWVDCDAGSDGTGTFASPFWGFETVGGWCTGDGCETSGDFTQGLLSAGDWLYVKGTCSTFTENATGPFQALKLLRRAQQGTSAEPTVITSWAGEPSPIFDGGFSEYALMWFQGTTGGGTMGYVDVNNIRLTRYRTFGIRYADGVRGGTVNSVEVYNGALNGTDGEGGGVTFFTRSGVHDYELTKSLFWNINANPSGSENNQGAITVFANAGGTAGSQVYISNVVVGDTRIGIRHKHSGPNLTIVNQSLIYDVKDGFYVRQPLTTQKVVIQDATRAAYYISEENYITPIILSATKNTAINTDRFFMLDDTNGGIYNSSVAATNSLYEDLGGTNRTWCLDCLGSASPSTWNFADITHNNNMYNVNAASQTLFAELDANTYTYANFIAGVGDGATSELDDPEFEADCSIAVTSPAAALASDGGPAGAIGFGTGAPIVTVNTLTTSNTSPALSGTVDDATATVSVTVNGNTYPAINNGNGTWTLPQGTISPALTLGDYDVEVEGTNASGTGTDATTDELSIVPASSTWVGSFLRRLCRWCF